MTERKNTERKTGLAIFRRLDAANLPAPWVPPDVPASTSTAGLPAKRDRNKSLPVPWVPAELPAVSTPAPAAAKSDRAVAKLKPWVPPELPPASAAPRNLPAVVADDAAVPAAPQKRKKKRGKRQSGELVETVSGNTGGGQTVINIVNQVAAPAPVYVSPWWGWWGGCPNFSCPRHYGRACFRVWCGWW